ELLAGPGRYTASQMPGEAGNFAVAGHRVGKGAPFNDLGNLRSCDAIVVETFASWNVYRVMPMSVDPTTRQQEAAACFTDTQGRGECGNFAGAAARVGEGAPFNDLGDLRSCDAIVVETFASWNVYRVMPMSVDPTPRQQEAAACFTDTQVQRMTGGEYAGVA